VYFEPKPVKGPDGIPFIVGGTSPAALKRAGTIGDGWTHHRQIRSGDRSRHLERDFEELEQHILTIRRHREEAGRTGPFEVVAGMGNEPSSISRAAELGVTMYTLGPEVAGLRGTKDQFVEWIETSGADLIASWSHPGAPT
jgi:alkanesulfonate monooxygenase SsuD/methylene tetrahydromethanopterin reductase-like flavin-dependent oxidoreductase (luciferase family)